MLLLYLVQLLAFAHTEELAGSSNFEISENNTINYDILITTEVPENTTFEINQNTKNYEISSIPKAENSSINDRYNSSYEVTESSSNSDKTSPSVVIPISFPWYSLLTNATYNSTFEDEYSGSNDYEEPEVVKFQFLYETGCPYSRTKYQELESTYRELGPYIDITTYPFGNAYITLTDSQLSIECQHGERECYGNRLHACAIDELKEPSRYIPYNACMMRHKRRSISNDVAADACGYQFNVTSEGIKSCAKGYRGFLLLVHYGIESEKLEYSGVPWWFVNDVPKRRKKHQSLRETICAAFNRPPKVCEYSSSSSSEESKF